MKQTPQSIGSTSAKSPTMAGEVIRLSQLVADDDHSSAVADMWLLVTGMILKYVRRDGWSLDDDVQRDIASDKATSIMERFRSGEWRPDPSPARLASYMRRVARNGVSDVFDRLRREGADASAAIDGDRCAPSLRLVGVVEPEPSDARVRRTEFSDALADCLSRLTERNRFVIELRLFHEFSSQEIADHPTVRSTPTAVDMALSRSRKNVSDCMNTKGQRLGELPPNTFVTLWLQRQETRSREEPA